MKYKKGERPAVFDRTTHGLSYSRIYRIFHSMKARCNQKTHMHYSRYGGRGIKVEWKNFQEFYNDMGKTYKEGLCIDRINNNGNYCKENCRWVTYKENNRNTSKNRYYNINGKLLLAVDIAKITGLKLKTLNTRIHRGWDIKKALQNKNFRSKL